MKRLLAAASAAVMLAGCAGRDVRKREEPRRGTIEMTDKAGPAPTPAPETAPAPSRAPARRPLKTPGVFVFGQERDTVSIGVQRGVNRITLQCGGTVYVANLDERTRTKWVAGVYNVSAAGRTIYINGRAMGRRVRFEPDNANNQFMNAGGKKYRGNIAILTVGEGRMSVVSVVTVDDYLKGVLPREVVVTWAMESLKAQAVAARTYLASHLNRHRDEGFDLCSDVHCQVYGGMAKEHPNSNRAVDETRGQILVHRGRPIDAYFHSNCGGETEQVSYVWGLTDQPYLPRVKCGWGTEDPRYDWSYRIAGIDMLVALRRSTKVRGQVLKGFDVKRTSPSGRAETIVIRTNEGTYTMRGNDFRIALHPEKIRSTLWTDWRREGAEYVFTGRGWGHGLGYCQWGGKGQAEAGRNYQEILEHYYPHAELMTWAKP